MENSNSLCIQRRVGAFTPGFTLGFTLVAVGTVMLLSVLLTQQNNVEALVIWSLKLSPDSDCYSYVALTGCKRRR